MREAAAVLDQDAAAAAALAGEALALARRPAGAAIGDDGPLREIRRAGGRGPRPPRGVILARASSRTGAHADALPALEAAHAERPDDESLLADLLRSEAAVRGPARALERFERYRRDLRERLGADPGEAAAADASAPARARPPGAQRRALRREHAASAGSATSTGCGR